MPEGSSFSATGQIDCVVSENGPIERCDFGVIRRGGGSATVVAFWPDGSQRYLYFEAGELDSTDATAGSYADRSGDEQTVYVGTTERYEIFDAILFGG